jgi:hypothetical protein
MTSNTRSLKPIESRILMAQLDVRPIVKQFREREVARNTPAGTQELAAGRRVCKMQPTVYDTAKLPFARA